MKQLAILGGGPAGLTASIYASRYNVNHYLIASEAGGYLNEIHKIENYPGFTSISGTELTRRMKNQAESLGAEIVQDSVAEITKIENGFQIKTGGGSHEAENVIFAVGTVFRKINIPGEKEFMGRGVSYCATCDGPIFKNKKVVVIGGGNSAAVAALMLSEYAKSVAIIYRKKELPCAPAFAEQIKQSDKIELINETNITEIQGDVKVQKVLLDKEYEGKKEFETDGVFIEIGSDPNVSLIHPLDIALSDGNYIQTNPDQSTNVPGFYAAGDVTTNSKGFRQIVTACSEGAIAAYSVYERLKSEK